MYSKVSIKKLVSKVISNTGNPFKFSKNLSSDQYVGVTGQILKVHGWPKQKSWGDNDRSPEVDEWKKWKAGYD